MQRHYSADYIVDKMVGMAGYMRVFDVLVVDIFVVVEMEAGRLRRVLRSVGLPVRSVGK